MHYCIHLLTKHLPTEKEIEKIMEPYEWDSIDDEDMDGFLTVLDIHD
jgi:hypothetical protein